MLIPPYLQAGDTIAITCPAGYLDFEKTIVAKQTLESWGFHVILGDTVGTEHFYFSGTDEARLKDLQQFLDDDNIKAILMGRGGYGLSRIIDRINFSKFVQHPKWVCGFSDITILHSHIHARFGIATLHSPMCGAFRPDTAESEYILSLHSALSAQPVHYPEIRCNHNRNGEAAGILIGGNLAILAHLSGSVSQMDTNGKILFIEDIGEYLYNADRMLINLQRAGMLDGLAGLICGGFTDMQDTTRPFGQDIYQVILDKVSSYKYPVAFDFPTGHGDVNYTLALGLPHKLAVHEHICNLRITNYGV